MQTSTPNDESAKPQPFWSNRILILSLIGIFFLTFYPFRFEWDSAQSWHGNPFLLGGSGKAGGVYNVFLNILLFIPFGFGLAEKLLERGKTRRQSQLLCFLAGALLSYTIEFVQLYIPGRDSGWEDVATNATGSVVGFLLFGSCGLLLLRVLGRMEAFITKPPALRRLALLMLIYFGVWLGISVPLQMKTRLSNWKPDALLSVGNDAGGNPSTMWEGNVSQLEIWDHAIPADVARKITAGEIQADGTADAMAMYDFSVPPFRDRLKFLPPLDWSSEHRPQSGSEDVFLDGTSWLISAAPVSDLVSKFQWRNQFAFWVMCTPAIAGRSDGRIVSISEPSGPVDLQIRQDGSDLVLWFRNGLSVRRAILAWYVPQVFNSLRLQDILFAYDGTDVSLYINGVEQHSGYHLGPGTGLAQYFRIVKPSELDGYNDIYYFLVFFPFGALLGLAWRVMEFEKFPSIALFWGVAIPAMLLECTLVIVSGRAFSAWAVLFSAFITVAGGLWMNADGIRGHSRTTANDAASA